MLLPRGSFFLHINSSFSSIFNSSSLLLTSKSKLLYSIADITANKMIFFCNSLVNKSWCRTYDTTVAKSHEYSENEIYNFFLSGIPQRSCAKCSELWGRNRNDNADLSCNWPETDFSAQIREYIMVIQTIWGHLNPKSKFLHNIPSTFQVAVTDIHKIQNISH